MTNLNFLGLQVSIDFESIFTSFNRFANQDPLTMAFQLFIHGGWIIFAGLMLYGVYEVFLDYRQGQFAGKWKHVLLAIDIPRNNEQTPKAVENIFSALGGAQTNGSWLDNVWGGKVQESFSFEIVSLEGYVQFLVRTPSQFRDMIEATIYSQYPEAEITEVEDYTNEYKNLKFPNKEFNLWGSEFVLTKPYPYPIRTYPEFEHQATQTFIDPMASLLENLSRLGEGEQCWLQLVITPLKQPAWGEKAKEVVSKILGRPYEAPVTFADKLLSVPYDALTAVGNLVSSGTVEVKKEEEKFKVMNLSPGDRSVLERIQQKIGKTAFRVKYRMVYLAKIENFKKSKVVTGVTAAIQQFNTSDANGLKPGGKGNTKTSADYFFVNSRVAKKQRRILYHYCGRENWYGEPPMELLLNAEELATLWHFPVMTVKATSVETSASKKAVAPSRLPFASRGGWVKQAVKPVRGSFESKLPFGDIGVGRKSEPPMNLPGSGLSQMPGNLPFAEPTARIKPREDQKIAEPENDLSFDRSRAQTREEKPVKKQAEPPANLPMI